MFRCWFACESTLFMLGEIDILRGGLKPDYLKKEVSREELSREAVVAGDDFIKGLIEGM